MLIPNEKPLGFGPICEADRDELALASSMKPKDREECRTSSGNRYLWYEASESWAYMGLYKTLMELVAS